MTNHSPIKGANAPQSPDSGPFEPLQNELRPLRTMMGLFFDNPDEFIRDSYEEVLALPPEERFTESVNYFVEQIVEEVGDVETIRALTPTNQISGQRLNNIVIDLCDQLIDSTLKGVWRFRDSSIQITLSSGFLAVKSGFSHLMDEPEIPKQERDQILSSGLAFFARLTHLQDLDEDEIDTKAVIRDVAYTLHYIEDAIDDEPQFPNPSTLEFEEIQQMVYEFGAAIAYRYLNISVGRGAELANISRFEFEEVLEKHGVEPRYGPSSVEELYDDDDVGITDG